MYIAVLGFCQSLFEVQLNIAGYLFENGAVRSFFAYLEFMHYIESKFRVNLRLLLWQILIH